MQGHGCNSPMGPINLAFSGSVQRRCDQRHLQDACSATCSSSVSAADAALWRVGAAGSGRSTPHSLNRPRSARRGGVSRRTRYAQDPDRDDARADRLARPHAPASAPAARLNVTCKLTFTMKGWSAFYKTSSGTGTIKCNNGQSMNVTLEAKGGGLTVGKSSIEDGHGEFSAVNNIERAARFVRLGRSACGRSEVRQGAGDDEGRGFARAERHRPRLGSRHRVRQADHRRRLICTAAAARPGSIGYRGGPQTYTIAAPFEPGSSRTGSTAVRL